MTLIDERQIQFLAPTLADHPLLLWLGQSVRRIQGKPLKQQEVLGKVLAQMKADEMLLGALLFGSVASGTHKWQSDIDLIFIYERHDPPAGVVDRFVDGVLVQYFYATLDTVIENLQTVPYLLHIFCNGRLLYDRDGTVAPVIDQIEQYFASHPEVEAEWARLKELHQVEKMSSECHQTTILQRWEELEAKYSGGVQKRTFFRTVAN
jgi:predicted nucleotidyltransferase